MLFAGFFVFAKNADAAITQFTITPTVISDTGATFEIVLRGDETDIGPEIRRDYLVRIYSTHYGDGDGGATILQEKIVSGTTVANKPVEKEGALYITGEVSGLKPGEVYYAAAIRKGEFGAIDTSTLVHFKTPSDTTPKAIVATNLPAEETLTAIAAAQAAPKALRSFEIKPAQISPSEASFLLTIAAESAYSFEESFFGDTYGVNVYRVNPITKDELVDANNIKSYKSVSISKDRLSQTFTVSFSLEDNLEEGIEYYAVGVRETENLFGRTILDRTGTESFKLGEDGAFVTSTSREQNQSLAARDVPECEPLTGGWRGILGCISNIINLFIIVTSWISVTSAEFLDVLLDISISSETYRQSDFIQQGWGVLRDFANIIFIFVLAFAALSTVLDLGWFDTKKTIKQVIVVALFINFSLFLTNLVVDAGNITARVFYNAVNVEDERSATDENSDFSTDSGLTRKSLSVAVAEKMQPQKFFSEDIFNSSTDIGYFIFMQLVIITVNLVIAYTFLSIAFLFVGRIVGLMVAMIASPVAFISTVLPQSFTKQMQGFGWSTWLGNLFSLSFMAPVFLFFLYLILTFLNVNENFVSSGVGNSASAAGKIINLALPIVIILFLLQVAKKTTSDLSGKIGTTINNWAGTAVGLAAGAATGGAALLARGTLGAGASALAKSSFADTLRDAKADGNFVTRRLANLGLKSIESGSKGSWDLRQTAAGSQIAKTSGINFDQKQLGAVGLSTKDTKGGFEGQKAKIEKEKLEYAESLKSKLSDDDVLVTHGTKDEIEAAETLTGKDRAKLITKIRNTADKKRIESYGERLENEAGMSNMRLLNIPASILSAGEADSARTQAELAAAKKIRENALHLSGGKVDKKKKSAEEKLANLKKDLKDYADQYEKKYGEKINDTDTIIAFAQEEKEEELRKLDEVIKTMKRTLDDHPEASTREEDEKVYRKHKIQKKALEKKIKALGEMGKNVEKAESSLASLSEEKGKEKKEEGGDKEKSDDSK